MHINKDESITIQLKDYSELLLVLSKHDYWNHYVIKSCYNKHKGLSLLIKEKTVIKYLIKCFPNWYKSNFEIISK